MYNITDYLHAFNSIIVPPSNHGLPRSQMPQLLGSEQEFQDYLHGLGVESGYRAIKVSDLKLTQNEINKDKVLSIMQSPTMAEGSPLIVSADNHVLDGSHRFVAMYNCCPNSNTNALVADLPMSLLLPLAQAFHGADYVDHQDK